MTGLQTGYNTNNSNIADNERQLAVEEILRVRKVQQESPAATDKLARRGVM